MNAPEGGSGNVPRVFLGVFVGTNVPGIILIAPSLALGEMFAIIPLAVSVLIAFLVTLLCLMPLYFFVSRRVARLHWIQSLVIGSSILGLFYVGLVLPSAFQCRDGSTYMSSGVMLCDDGNLTIGFAVTHGIYLLGALFIGALSGLVGWLLAFGRRKVVPMGIELRSGDGQTN